MLWYIEKPEDRPLAVLDEIRKMDRERGIESLKPEDQTKLLKQLQAWEAARAKNLFLPNLKERIYFLMPHKTRAISGANRSGKTATNAVDMVMQAEGWHPLQRHNLEKLVNEAYEDWVKRWCEYLLKNERWISSPPVDMRIVAVDFTAGVEKITGPEIIKWATKNDLDPNGINYGNDKKRTVIWKNRSFIDFLTSDQELKAHMGVARHKVYFDEEVPKDYWTENVLRTTSLNGKLGYGATAINGVTWTEDDIFQEAEWVEDYIKDMIERNVLHEPQSNIFAMEMTIWENPMNTDEAIEEVKVLCKDDIDVQIRLYGKRVLRGGQVFYMARDEYPWVIPRFKLPENGALIMAIDPHPKIEHAVLWIWVDYEGRVQIDDNKYTPELINGKPNLFEVAESFKHGTVPQLAKDIENVEEMLGRRHDFALCDSMAWVTDQARNEKSIVAQLNDEGIYPDKGSKDLDGGIIKTQELLTKEDMFRINVYEHPRLMTFEDLERVRWEGKNYRWKTRKGKHKEDMSEPQKPVDKDDHMMENRRRICEYVVDYEAEVLEFTNKPARMTNMMGEPIDVNWDEEDEETEDLYML